MQYKKKYIKKFIIFTAVIILIFCGCSQKSEQPKFEQQSQKEEQKSEEVPKQLSELEDNIEKIIKSLDGPSVSKKTIRIKRAAKVKTPGNLRRTAKVLREKIRKMRENKAAKIKNLRTVKRARTASRKSLPSKSLKRRILGRK